MLERVLEPELMDDPEEAQAYDDMDHEGVNKAFVQDFLQVAEGAAEILDLGTGTARIPIELCRSDEECRVLASDAAVSMLEVAKINVAIEGFEGRILLHHGDSKQLDLADDMFDAVISNSLLHHLPEPRSAVDEMVRVVRPAGWLFVRDLLRPESAEQVEELVTTYAGQETDYSKQLFRQSLVAALSLDEIRTMVGEAGFDPSTVQQTTDRHWTWAASKPTAE